MGFIYTTLIGYLNTFRIQNYRYLEATAKKGIALCVLDRAEEATQLLFDCMKFVDHTDAKVITYYLLSNSLCKCIDITKTLF